MISLPKLVMSLSQTDRQIHRTEKQSKESQTDLLLTVFQLNKLECKSEIMSSQVKSKEIYSGTNIQNVHCPHHYEAIHIMRNV